MLIKCPECELQVSDKALSCPHCGYPLKISAERKTRKFNKRRRLPNGFGQISEIKNRNLRKPFRVMVTVGKNQYGKPICKPLKPDSYFETYNDAYAALIAYNKNPYQIEESITLKELYEQWSDKHFEKLSSISSIRGIKSAWVYCEPLYDMEIRNIKTRHIRSCIENANRDGHEASINTKIKMKSILNLMFDYAVEYELTDRNYAKDLKTYAPIKERNINSKNHISFAEDELDLLWKNVNTPYVDMVIVQCYSGWRPQELGLIRIENVNIKEMTFSGGLKTESGKNRIVPIHSKIQNLVSAKYQEAKKLGSEYLFNYTTGRKTYTNFTYERYSREFTNICKELKLNPKHRPHDGRKTFVTLCKKYQVDEYAIKYMAGHTITDITESIYTDRSVEWLKEEIEKIK